FIGAARPSIADPFLPKKIEEDRIEDIRECIGCNICVSSDTQGIPIRCTQNPTMGEEWRRGWHPEMIAPKKAEKETLVIGAGPSGLECALQLARRGYQVTLAEAAKEVGGRVLAESGLPGLSAWRRVIDNRLFELRQKANVRIFTESELDADAVHELDIPNVFIATGASWRVDGVGRNTRKSLAPSQGLSILSPDKIMAGQLPADGPVLIYDDDQAYLAGVLAEKLARDGYQTIIATPAAVVSPWMEYTLEQNRIQTRLVSLGIDIHPSRLLTDIGPGFVVLNCGFSGNPITIPCQTLVPVTERARNTSLYETLLVRNESSNAFHHLELIGDAAAPGLIADATYAGHMAARNFEADPAQIEADLFRREIPSLA
ncbi:MAG: FAD-dependent oxidoreductase, partial [Rhodobacteraceae bacterium]|nr:FAD-dependent oxidoreductase [Paracoccaceae bacterium]